MYTEVVLHEEHTVGLPVCKYLVILASPSLTVTLHAEFSYTMLILNAAEYEGLSHKKRMWSLVQIQLITTLIMLKENPVHSPEWV